MTREPEIGTIGIVGAGAKGRDIAVYSLFSGYRVMIEDVSATRLAEAIAHMADALRGGLARGEMDTVRGREMAAKWSATQSMDEVSRSADLLIAAAPEDAELQLEIFTIFDKFAKPSAILASAAVEIAIADLAEMTNCPERCVGLQFPEPAAKQKYLRIISAPQTSENTLRICMNLARRMRLDPEMIRESPTAMASPREAQTP